MRKIENQVKIRKIKLQIRGILVWTDASTSLVLYVIQIFPSWSNWPFTMFEIFGQIEFEYMLLRMWVMCTLSLDNPSGEGGIKVLQ